MVCKTQLIWSRCISDKTYMDDVDQKPCVGQNTIRMDINRNTRLLIVPSRHYMFDHSIFLSVRVTLLV